MKTKLEMAHDYLRDIVSNWEYDDSFDPVAEAWKYADAMQAEADKRECKERTDVLLTKDKDGNCLHFHHEFGHKKCMDCGASLEEWQPDWSQAPDSLVKYFAVDKNGRGGWFISKPTLCSDHWYWSDFEERVDNDNYDYAPSFGYTGDWRNSLRKRHE